MPETAIANYLLHIAPSVVVLLLLLRRSEDHWAKVDALLQDMLAECWQTILQDRDRPG